MGNRFNPPALVLLAAIIFACGSAGASAPPKAGAPGSLFASPAPDGTAVAATLPSGFSDTVAISGLTNPTNFRFASDGRIFVAQKNGVVLEYDSLQDTTPTTVIDLSSQVDNYWDRGLLGLALDPNFPATPNIYLLYSYDGATGTDAPKWNDACNTPPGPTTDGCPITGKLIRVAVGANSVSTGTTTLIQGQWCQQFPSHSIGDLQFGPDGQLYVSGGDGASFTFSDYGQAGGSSGSQTPANPCGDPPSPAGTALTPPSAEGGALRSQSLRRASGEPVLLNGAVLRVDPSTGAGSTGNPLAGSANANAKRIVAYGFRNPFRFVFRPGTKELWIGDVGWGTWEEVNRLTDPTTLQAPVNFGWPCYEGTPIQSSYQADGLALCASLYSAGTTTRPFYAYSHSAAVAAGDGCSTANGSVVSALAFYSGTSYPAAYRGALVFGDHSRTCIWAMQPDANGLPNPSNVSLLVGGAANPVDLEPGPNGDIFYADFDGGTIHRLTFDSGGGGGGGGGACTTGQFEAQYFANQTLTGTPTIDRCETTINNTWGASGPGSGIPTDHFSARWNGQFTFSGGTTTFTTTSDDGIRLWLDGTLLIDHWINQSPTTYTATTNITAGTHTVKIEYFENTGGATAQASWSP